MFDKLDIPGVHAGQILGPVGQLEVELSVPTDVDQRYVAILGHPHSLQGGTMYNKVVTTLVRTFNTLNIPSIRYNFRGVGLSAGTYDAGVGESEDMLFLAREYLQRYPGVIILFAGFSYGSYVAYRAAAQCPHALLITIAPSVINYNYAEFLSVPKPWLIIQGEDDEVVSPQDVFDFATNALADIEVIRFADTSHFFHGKLIELKSCLIDAIKARID